MRQAVWFALLSAMCVFSAEVSAKKYIPVGFGNDFTIIIPVDEAPVAQADSFSVVEDTSQVLDILSNDSDETPQTLSVSIATQTAQGTLQLAGDGRTLTYSPHANFSGNDSFAYFLTDEKHKTSETVTVQINVSGVNDAPVVADVAASVSEDQTVTIAPDGTDADGSLLAYQIVTQPGSGHVEMFNNQFVYTPAANFSGSDSFTYQAYDGQLTSGSAQVNISVLPVNDAPVARADTFALNEDTALTALAVSANDADVDSSAFTLELIQHSPLPDFAGRTLSLSSDAQTIHYQPPADIHGQDWFTYRRIDDAGAASEVVRVTLNIAPQNDAPSAWNLVAQTDEDTAVTIAPSGADTDGDNLTFTASTAANGTVSLNNGEFLYTPAANFHGQDSFTYVANDGTTTSAPATVTVTVNAVNDAPNILSQVSNLTINEDQATIVNILEAVSDPDGDELRIDSMTVNVGTLEEYNRTEFVYKPVPHYNDSQAYADTIRATVTVTDGTDYVPLHWDISVTPVTDAPDTTLYWRKTGATHNNVDFFVTVKDEDNQGYWQPYIFIFDEQGNSVENQPNYFDATSQGEWGDRLQYRDFSYHMSNMAPGVYRVTVEIVDIMGLAASRYLTTQKTFVIGDDPNNLENQPPVANDDTQDDLGFLYAGADDSLDVLFNDSDDNGEIAITLVDNINFKDSDGNPVARRGGKPQATLETDDSGKHLNVSTDVCFAGDINARYTITDEQGATASADVKVSSYLFDENTAASPQNLSSGASELSWSPASDTITLSWSPVHKAASTRADDYHYKVMIVDDNGQGYVVPSVTADNFNATTGLFEYPHRIRQPGKYYAYVATCEPGSLSCGCYGDEAVFNAYSKSVRNFRVLNDVLAPGDDVVIRWANDPNHEYTLRHKSPGGNWQEFNAYNGEFTDTLSIAGIHEYQIKVCYPEVDSPCGGWSATLPVTVRQNTASVEAAPTAAEVQASLSDYSNNTSGSVESAKVGLTAGQFRVDESGAATYQIPFALPQGIAGVTPSLGLSYSSAAGNGQAGMGWGLSGLSQISRCRRTMEQDGEAGRTPDRFCLGGQRLMEVHSTLDGVREFRTEIDSKTRIRAYGDHNNPSHFIVEGEDGSVRYYGEKSIEGDVANTVITGNNLKLSWMITSISDNVGAASTSATNHVLFHYDNVAPWQGTYEIVLSEVIYSGNRVEFKWQDRPDNRISYHYGAGSHATQRLDKVFVYNHSNTKIRGYDLDYDTSYVDYEAEDFAVISRLQYLTECGYTGSGSAVCRSPLQFDWYNKPGLSASASQEFTIAGTSGFTVESVIPTDLNGDGFTDLLILEQHWDDTQHSVLRVMGSANGFGTAQAMFTFNYVSTTSRPAQLLPVDIDGDGMLEVLYYDSQNIGFDTPNYIYTWHYAAYRDSDGQYIPQILTASAAEITILRPTDTNWQLIPHDVNADGRPDLLYQQGDMFVALNTGHGFGGLLRVDIPEDNTLVQAPISDFNADGIADFMTRHENNIGDITYTPYSLVKNTFTRDGTQYHYQMLRSGYTEFESFAKARTTDYVFVTTGDINGDGQSDVLYLENIESTELKYDLAGRTSLTPERIALPESHQALTLKQLQVLDMNKDQRPDIVYFNTAWYVLYQEADGDFRAPVNIGGSTGFHQEDDKPLLADWNSDGEPGVGFLDMSKGAISYSPDRYQGSAPVNLLRNIRNNFGVNTDIEYAQLNDSSVYTVGDTVNSADYGNGSPVFNLVNPSFVVSRVTSDSDGYRIDDTSLSRVRGNDARLSVSYHYSGLRAQAGGRGLLGFAQMSTMDEQRGIVTTTTYRQDFPFTGMPVSTTQTYYGASDLSWDNLSGGTVFSSASNEYRTETIQRTNSDRITHFPYLYRSVENQYVVQSSGSVTQTGTLVTTNEYQKFNNNHFNLTRSCVQHHNGEFTGVSGDGCGAGISGSLIKAVITSNSYNLSGADLSEEQGSLTDWTLGRLRSTSVSHTTSAGTDTRHSRFEYITGTADPLRGLLKREIIAPDSADETLNLTTLHCYDSVGNETGAVTHSNHYSDVNSCSVSKPLSDDPYQVFRRQTTTYDAAKRYVLSTANDKQTLQTFSDHNRFGQPELVTDVNGVTTTLWYDAFGSAFATQKSTGERQLTERRRKAHISQMGVPAVISDFYFAEKISSTNPQGDKAAPDALKFYDKLGRTVATARAGFEADTWYVTLSSYDVFGRQVSTTEPYTWQLSGSEPKRRHYINYDWQGRPVKSTDVSGVVTQMTYSTAAHQLTTRTTLTSDTKTQVRTSTSNLLGQTVQVIDDVGAENATIDYTYTPTGKLHTAGVGNNIVTTDHDAYGRKMGMQDKNKGNWNYSYNALGELVTQTKLGQNGNTQSNIVTTFTRDTLGRTTERQVTENGSTERTLYQFDGTHIHQLRTQCFAQGSTGAGCDATKPVKTFAYDSAGRAHQMTTTINDGTTSHSLTTATTFDTFGRVFQQFDDNDQHYGLRFHYNAQGYQYMQEEARYSNDCQAATNTALNGCANIVYSRVTATNAYGKALSVEQNNGIVTTTNRYDRRTGLLTDRAVRSDNTLIQYNEYQYNDLGNMILRRRNSLNQTDNANTGAISAMAHYQDSDLTIAQSLTLNTQKFGYDNLNRLTTLNGKQWISYDAQGNITHKADVGHYCYDAARPNAVSKTSKTDSSCHNEAAYTYDAWGNQTTGRGRTIDYGHFDKAVSITKDSKTTTFAYDTGRNRYQRITDLDGTKQERTLYFGSQERIYERDNSSAPWTLTKTRRNLPGAIQTVYPTGAEDTHFQHKGNLGSVNTVTNENGRIVQKMYFDPWGKKFMLPETMWTDTARNMQAPTLAGLLDITPRGFTGHEHVDHADIIHMNGRIYDPTLGRFLQADPFIQSPLFSQSYNRYSYGMNNPLSGTDPSGYIFDKLVRPFKNVIRSTFRVLGQDLSQELIKLVSDACGPAKWLCERVLQYDYARAFGATSKQALRGAFTSLGYAFINSHEGWNDFERELGYTAVDFGADALFKESESLRTQQQDVASRAAADKGVAAQVYSSGGNWSDVTGGKFANGVTTDTFSFVSGVSGLGDLFDSYFDQLSDRFSGALDLLLSTDGTLQLGWGGSITTCAIALCADVNASVGISIDFRNPFNSKTFGQASAALGNGVGIGILTARGFSVSRGREQIAAGFDSSRSTSIFGFHSPNLYKHLFGSPYSDVFLGPGASYSVDFNESSAAFGGFGGLGWGAGSGVAMGERVSFTYGGTSPAEILDSLFGFM